MIEIFMPEAVRSEKLTAVCQKIDPYLHKALAQLNSIEQAVDPSRDDAHEYYKQLLNIHMGDMDKEKIVIQIKLKFQGDHTLKTYETELSTLFNQKITLSANAPRVAGKMQVGQAIQTATWSHVITVQGLTESHYVKANCLAGNRIHQPIRMFKPFVYQVYEYIKLKKQAHVLFKTKEIFE